MATRSSSFSRFPLVTVVVLLQDKLQISSPVLSLLDSSYPTSRVELLLVGESRWMPASDVQKKLRVKSVKQVVHSSKNSFYPHVARLVQGSIVLFTRSDCRPSNNWVKEMVAAFRRDPEMGLVLGEVQWRTSDPKNKVGNYCEQTGLDSAWQQLGVDSSTYLTSKKRSDSTDVLVDPVVPLLTPTNLGLKTEALTLIAKSPHSLDNTLTREEISALERRKMRLFYEPAAIIEQRTVMNTKKLMNRMSVKALRSAAWDRFGGGSALRIRLQFAGEHEILMPFPISVDIAWGDFHWLHLWGVAGLWKTLWMFTFGHAVITAWDTDAALFDLSFFGFFAFRYFLPVLKVQPWSDFILWCWLRYRSNMLMFWGGIKASFKFKCFLWTESW